MKSYHVKYSFSGDIKCTSCSICSIYPVNNSLPVSILIIIHFTISITERVPVLSYCKVWFTCFQVVFDISTPKAANKIKSPSIISNFISAMQAKQLWIKHVILTFLQNSRPMDYKFNSYHIVNGKYTKHIKISQLVPPYWSSRNKQIAFPNNMLLIQQIASVFKLRENCCNN